MTDFIFSRKKKRKKRKGSFCSPTDINGSCCYSKSGMQKCISKISCERCSSLYGGSWSKVSCAKRISKAEEGCCKMCNKKTTSTTKTSKDKNTKVSKFRSMVNKNVQLTTKIQDENEIASCEEQYIKNIQKCNNCIGGTSSCKKACIDVAKTMRILCIDSHTAEEKTQGRNLSEKTKIYYRCISKTKNEQLKNIQTLFNNNACLCNNETQKQDTKLYKEFTTTISFYSRFENDCRKLAPENTSEGKVGCCCEYIKNGKESSVVGSRHTGYSSGDLRRCTCTSYSECNSKRGLYDVCWSSDCDCSNIKNTTCSGKEDSNNCSCCINNYEDTRCFEINNPEEVERKNSRSAKCWIRVCNCFVEVPAPCNNNCWESYTGIRIGSKILGADDIEDSKPDDNICNGRPRSNGCLMEVGAISSPIKCDFGDCSCGKVWAEAGETRTCNKFIIFDYSDKENACENCPKQSADRKDERGRGSYSIETNCCNCSSGGGVERRSATKNETKAPSTSSGTSDEITTDQGPVLGGGGVGSGSGY